MTNWRDDLESLKSNVKTELALAREAGKKDGARGAAEGLNQSVRRIRQARDEADLLALLVETAAPFSQRAAAIVFDGSRARTSALRGFVSPEIQFDVNQAAAVLAAIETKDPVAAAAIESEFSPELCAAVSRDLETSERGFLFPVVVTGAVRALLFALGSVEAAPLELLSETAAMRLEFLSARPRVSSVSDAKPAWSELSPANQALHLKAQRFARVAVAEMRLARPSAVREGQERGTIYQSLLPEIDAARETFRNDFMQHEPTMVDYLYIELVRSLTNEDAKLLGPDFPGRLI